MKAVAILRHDMEPSDWEDMFFAFSDIFSQYDWLISDTDLFFQPTAPKELQDRLCWTGLLMKWDELETVLRSYEWTMISGVLSALPSGITEKQAQRLPLPVWASESYWNEPTTFQTPLTEIEVAVWDGYLLLLLAKDDTIADRFMQLYPKAMTLPDYMEQESNKFSGKM